MISPGLLEFTMEGNADKLYCLLEEGNMVDTKVRTKKLMTHHDFYKFK